MTDKQYYEYKRIKYEMILREMQTAENKENIGQTATKKTLDKIPFL